MKIIKTKSSPHGSHYVNKSQTKRTTKQKIERYIKYIPETGQRISIRVNILTMTHTDWCGRK